jgi:thiol:disulfide interchange protein DsbA
LQALRRIRNTVKVAARGAGVPVSLGLQRGGGTYSPPRNSIVGDDSPQLIYGAQAMRRHLQLLLILLTTPLWAQAYDEGMEYEEILPAVATDSGDRVEVAELFFYGCPHCFRLEPILEQWLAHKPANVDFKRVPAIFQPSWEPLARAYFTAEMLDVLDRIHLPLFKALHDKKQPLYTEAALRDFFVQHGVAAEDFDATYHSFAVENQIRRAKDLTRRYGIRGVPSMVVNGKYRTNGTIAGGMKEVPKVVDFLIRQESSAPAS